MSTSIRAKKHVFALDCPDAERHPHQPSERGSFLVMLDPAGHQFCLCEPLD